jgi:pimeloyl-ACP methyl ester carboxylesterase
MKYLYGFLCVFTFGYSFSNDYVINSFDNHPIHGTLLESAESNSILSIIISGSGPTDRDGNSTYIKSDYLKMLAEGLFENGISSYRYDKREVGNSIGNIKSGEEVKFSDFINDAISIINHFRGTNKFKKVVVIGHSEGALIGMIASRLIVDSFISISGAGEDYLTLIQRQLSIQPAYVKSMSDPIIEKLKNKELVDSVPPLINSLFNNTIQKYLIDASSYDPKEEISKLDIPVLIVQGSNDIQIEIKDAQLLHNAAIKSRLEIIQGMNHVFRQSPENRLLNMQTYGNPELPIDASLVNLIVDFLDED